MDPHVRWMRRFLLSKTAGRVSVEAVVVGAAAGAGAFTYDPSLALAAVLGLLVAQVTAGLRLATAVLGNPIDHRYLMAWSNPAGRLRPSPDRVPENLDAAAALGEVGFEHVLRLDDDHPGGIDVFQATSGLAVLAVADDGELTALSRLADGRLLVTSPGFVPPYDGVIVGRHRRAQPLELLTTHVERLEALRRAGATPVTAKPSLVLDQIRAEWQAWQELGPFIGPLVATGERRRNPLRLQFRIPDQLVWDRSRSTGLPPVQRTMEEPSPSPMPATEPPTVEAPKAVAPVPSPRPAPVRRPMPAPAPTAAPRPEPRPWPEATRTPTPAPAPVAASDPTPAPAGRNWFDPPAGPPASRNRRRTDRGPAPTGRA